MGRQDPERQQAIRAELAAMELPGSAWFDAMQLLSNKERSASGEFDESVGCDLMVDNDFGHEPLSREETAEEKLAEDLYADRFDGRGDYPDFDHF